MFEGFAQQRIKTSGAEINLVVGGKGPPLLLLHGYPQTHVIWHLTAPELAKHFTVVATDLRGYGDSSKPPSGEKSANYAKREMARDQVEVMEAQGFTRFGLVGHDRGGRVAHRLAIDWPDRVERLVTLDIAPTREMYRNTSDAFARAYWHWFFLLRPSPVPERMIGADPEFYWRQHCGRTGAGLSIFDPRAVDEYIRCFKDPETVRAACDDYRAAATIDIEQDDADPDQKIHCPLLALWGDSGAVGRCFDPLALWRERASDVRGHALPSGHYIPEEAPVELLAEIKGFFGIGQGKA